MPKFLLTTSPVQISIQELRFEIEAESAQAAEEIYRKWEPDAPIKLVHEERAISFSPRQSVPVLVVAAPTACSCGETAPMESPSHPD